MEIQDNVSKAREIGLLNARQYRHNYGSEELTDSVNECIQSCIEMAEWKDQQYSEIIKEECNTSYESGLAEGERKAEARFKEYLISRRNKIADIDTKDYKGWEMHYMADIGEIINELFKEE